MRTLLKKFIIFESNLALKDSPSLHFIPHNSPTPQPNLIFDDSITHNPLVESSKSTDFFTSIKRTRINDCVSLHYTWRILPRRGFSRSMLINNCFLGLRSSTLSRFTLLHRYIKISKAISISSAKHHLLNNVNPSLSLANRIVGLPPSFHLNCFRLKPNIHCEVQAFQPISMSQATSLSKLQENKTLNVCSQLYLSKKISPKTLLNYNPLHLSCFLNPPIKLIS